MQKSSYILCPCQMSAPILYSWGFRYSHHPLTNSWLQLISNFLLSVSTWMSVKWKVKVLVTQSCLIFCDPTNCSPPGSSVHGILQARILEWVAICFSRGSSQSRDQTQVSCIAGRLFTIWATMEPTWISSRYLTLSMTKSKALLLPDVFIPWFSVPQQMATPSSHCSRQNLWSHPRILFFLNTPHPICQWIL